MAYSDEDLNSAVEAGVVSPEAVTAIRAHVAKLRDMPRGDEENFRLINSFNDIFVAIGVVIMLVAAGAIGNAIADVIAPSLSFSDFYNGQFTTENGQPSEADYDAYYAARDLNSAWTTLLIGPFVAITAWILAEFFTRKRRMALPSIILLLAFVGGVFAACFGLGMVIADTNNESTGGFIASAAGLVAAAAAWLHWKRFMVPITMAAGAAALAVTVIALIGATYSAATGKSPESFILGLVFVAGLVIFGFAMRWDMSDRERTTRRSDVAFWLHLLAAPMIAHPIFYSLGVIDNSDNIGIGGAIGVISIYVLFGIVALAIDRRALLVSALAYVLAALTFLFDRFGAVELNFALTALVIGSALLTLSAFWSPIRARIVGALPDTMQARVPVAIA